MSEPEGRESLPDWWRSGLSRRDVGASAALAVLVAAIGGAFVLGFGPGAQKGLPAPPTTHDPVPRERLISRFPAACGLSSGTIDEVIPKAEPAQSSDFGDCRWYSWDPDHVSQRRLTVKIHIFPATAGSESALPSTPGNPTYVKATPVASAMSSLNQITSPYVREKTVVHTVAGLGEEAYAGSSGASWADVEFRVANAVVSVAYQDDGLLSKSSTSKKSAIEWAFTSAAEVARSLGTSAAPRFAEQERAPAIRRLPDPCTTVPTALRKRLVKGATPTPGSDENADSASCSWTSERRVLEVTMLSEPDSALGGAVPAATRE